MEKVKPRTLSGFMELLPAPQVQMERIMQVLRETYALYGFYPLDTPLACEIDEIIRHLDEYRRVIRAGDRQTLTELLRDGRIRKENLG